jgi:hypothetical protein
VLDGEVLSQWHNTCCWCTGKFYAWVSTLLPILPQQFDENDDSELSESQMYVAEGLRVVNRAVSLTADGESTAVLLHNMASHTPSQNLPAGVSCSAWCIPLLRASTTAL